MNNPHGTSTGTGKSSEPVQVCPGLWRLQLPDQPFMVGHSVNCRSDPDSTILTNGVLLPPRTRLSVQVCEGCDPEVLMSPGPDFTFLIADHQPGCARYAELAARRTS